MLTLKALKWDNCFSYGDNNCIRFDQEPLTQLTGPNGAGKTSIALLLQEVLYGKNNKNIKKQDITNNKSGKKGYSISLDFEKDGNQYTVDLNRTSNLKFKLYKNGNDISSHTTLNTYKTLGQIVGIDDFKIFCQLIYQHSTDSLDFLTATDTNRKKFLINLLQLEKYLEYHEHFKDKVRIINNDISKLEGNIQTIESWVSKHKDMDFTKKELIKVPDYNSKDLTLLKELQDTLTNINTINRKIATNNEYKQQLSNLNPDYYLGTAPAQPNPSSTELRARIRVLESEENKLEKHIKHLENLPEVCSECLQSVDTRINAKRITKSKQELQETKHKIFFENATLEEAIWDEAVIKKYNKERDEFVRLNQLINNSLPSKSHDKGEILKKINSLDNKIKSIKIEITKAQKYNEEISAHNSKVEVIKNQLREMQEDLQNKYIELVEKENDRDILELLKKTFSTNGLVSYKIESSVKELEKRINKYLRELIPLQIYFKLSGEKLNIEILDDVGNVTSIANLSSGERARVNIATILAIRSLLSNLTTTKINFLMLDEVIGVIDAEGKEKLAEILLKENLNTFLVSHDWEHPLVPRINIVKKNNISRIEYD